MALVGPTLLTADASTLNQASYASASVSPTAGAGILVFVFNTDGTDAIRPTITSAFAIDGSWTDEGSAQQATLVRRLTLFSGKASGTPGSGAITADYASDSQTGCIIIVVEYTGQHATDFTTQPATIIDASGEVGESLALAGAVGSGSQMIAGIYHSTQEAQAAVTGAELAGSDVGYATPAAQMGVYWILDSNTVAASWTTSSATLGIGLEVIPSAGGTEHFGASELQTTASIAVAAKKDAKAATATPVTATIAVASKKDAHAATATPITTTIAVASKKDAKAATAIPLTVSVVTAAKKDAKGASAVPLTATVVTAATKDAHGAADLPITLDRAVASTKTAVGATAVPITVTFDTNGEVDGTITGAFSLESTFGATVTGKKDAHAAAAVPITFSVATTTAKVAYAAFALPIVITITVDGQLGEPAELTASRTGWVAGVPGGGYIGGGANGRIRQPVTGGIG